MIGIVTVRSDSPLESTLILIWRDDLSESGVLIRQYVRYAVPVDLSHTSSLG